MMHGVPKDLNLTRFHGATLIQVAIGEFQQQFIFSNPELHISVEGAWAIRNAAGVTVDRSQANDQRDSFKVHLLLGRSIVKSEVDSPRSFTLSFDNGWTLTVFDSSAQYESFSINPGNVYV